VLDVERKPAELAQYIECDLSAVLPPYAERKDIRQVDIRSREVKRPRLFGDAERGRLRRHQTPLLAIRYSFSSLVKAASDAWATAMARCRAGTSTVVDARTASAWSIATPTPETAAWALAAISGFEHASFTLELHGGNAE